MNIVSVFFCLVQKYKQKKGARLNSINLARIFHTTSDNLSQSRQGRKEGIFFIFQTHCT